MQLLIISLLIILIILVVIYLYILTDDNIILYNDKQYFEKFKTKTISNLLNNNEIKIPLVKNNKILIITYDNRPHIPYIIKHNQNLEFYSKKWNLDYKFFDKCDYNTYWCKIFMVLDELSSNNYDYVMWMDSDTYIFNTGINISDILNKYTSDIFIAMDNNPIYDITNAGVFIIKNSETGKQYLRDCINSFNPECKKINGTLKGKWAATCYEQGIMNILIANNYQNFTTILTNDIIFNFNRCNNNVFIMHMYASSSNNRIKCFNSKNKL